MTDTEMQDFESLLKTYPPAHLTAQQLQNAELDIYAGELATYVPRKVSEKLLDDSLDLIFEAELSASSPAELSEDLIEKLSLSPIISEVSEIKLPSLSCDLLDKLTNAIENTEEESSNVKVIPFPEAYQTKEKQAPKWYMSAAAVALLGLMAGFFAFHKPANNQIAATTLAPNISENAFPSISQNSDKLLNVSTNSAYLDIQDQGLIPSKNNKSFYRVVKAVVMETCLIENELGQQVQVQKPVEKLILIPAVTD